MVATNGVIVIVDAVVVVVICVFLLKKSTKSGETYFFNSGSCLTRKSTNFASFPPHESPAVLPVCKLARADGGIFKNIYMNLRRILCSIKIVHNASGSAEKIYRPGAL